MLREKTMSGLIFCTTKKMHAILSSCFQGKCNSVVQNHIHEVNTLSANNENQRYGKNIDAFMYLYICYACGIP